MITVVEYGMAGKGQGEGLIADDVLLTALEEAETIGISLEDVGVTKEVVDSLM